MRHWKFVSAVLGLCVSVILGMLGFNVYIIIALVLIAIGTLFWGAWPWIKIVLKIERNQLEEKPKSLLTVEKDVVKSNYGTLGISWGLAIKNEGTDRADDCRGYLVKIDFADPSVGQTLSSWPVNQPLQWESLPIGISNNSINIHSLSKEILQIANRDPTRERLGKHELYLAYVNSEKFREEHYLPISTLPGGNNYLIVITITSLNRLPLYAICYMSNHKFGSAMILLDVKTEEPSIDDCRRILGSHGVDVAKKLTSELYREIRRDSHGC